MKTIRKLSIFYPTIPPLDNSPTILRRMSTLSMNKTFTYFVNYKDFYSVHQFLFDHHDLSKLKLFNAPVHISCLITLLRLCMSSRVRKTYTNLCVYSCPSDDDIHSWPIYTLDCLQTAKQSVFLRIQVRASSQTKGLQRGCLHACKARALRAHKTLTPPLTDFFTDFEKKTDSFAVQIVYEIIHDRS